MTRKEINELKKRFKLEKSNIGHIYGCYVNGSGEVISYIDESLALMPQEEAEQYLNLLKKVLGSPRSLADIVFTSAQVQDSEEHRLLMALREDQPEARQAFFETVISSLDLGGSNYLILCANDAYDVPRRGGRDADPSAGDDADQVYRYFVCAVCPVQDGKLELSYFSGENEFHNCLAKQVVGAPELGFLFPAFDNRTTNIYNALFYSRKPDEVHYEFIEGVFHTEPDMTPAEIRAAFEDVLAETVDCSMELIRGVNERMLAKIDEHKDVEEPLRVSAGDLTFILADCGVEEEDLNRFRSGFEDRFGKAVLNPEDLIDTHHFEVKSGEVTITVKPEMSFLIEAREVDGKKYIMIPADGVELNGFAVKV